MILPRKTRTTRNPQPSTINLQLFSTANHREFNGRWSMVERREQTNHETHERHEKQPRRKEAQKAQRNIRRLTRRPEETLNPQPPGAPNPAPAGEGGSTLNPFVTANQR